MALFWFLAGVLSTLTSLVLMLPWLRKITRLASLPSMPWPVAVGAVAITGALFALYGWLGRAQLAGRPAVTITSEVSRDAAGLSGAMLSAPASAANPAARPSAGPMNSAIANLEQRLAKGGGTADDWELLAKSYEFLGRPDDASKARARQLPPLPPDAPSTEASPAAFPAAASVPAAGSGTVISGEVSLAAALSGKAHAGATLFIVAKSVDSPGPPVAVFRGSVGAWPFKFTLNDSQSMLPGRNLSSAGRVTIEARISQSGQPLPATGDLHGSTAVINPADRQPLKILIDRVIT